MSSDFVVRVTDVGKCYQIYEKPHHRLLQMILGRQGKYKYYREFWALQRITFEIGKGKVIGILGKNGAGKSTLLQIVCGTLAPTDGRVEVNGRIAALLELGSGFNPEFSGIENVYMNGQILGLSKQEMDSKLGDIENFADIGDFIRQPVKIYSSGMFARLAFSVAVHVDPDVLVVDEALSVGDSWFQHKSMAKMRQLMSNGCTVLFVSHSIESVRALCDEAIWIDAGRIKMQGDVTDVTNAYMNDIFIERNSILIEKMSGEEHGQACLIKLDEATEDVVTDGDLGQSSSSYREQIIKLLSAELVGENGFATDILRHNEVFQLRISLSVNLPIRNLNVGFIVTDRFGLELVGGNLLDSNALINRASGWGKYSVYFSSKMRLRGGQSYAVSIRFSQGECKKRSDMLVVATYEQHIIFEVLNDGEPSWLIFDNEYDAKVDVITDEK